MNYKINAYPAFQFACLASVIGLNVLIFIKTGQLNDTLTGCLIGLSVGIQPPDKTQS